MNDLIVVCFSHIIQSMEVFFEGMKVWDVAVGCLSRKDLKESGFPSQSPK